MKGVGLLMYPPEGLLEQILRLLSVFTHMPEIAQQTAAMPGYEQAKSLPVTLPMGDHQSLVTRLYPVHVLLLCF